MASRRTKGDNQPLAGSGSDMLTAFLNPDGSMRVDDRKEPCASNILWKHDWDDPYNGPEYNDWGAETD